MRTRIKQWLIVGVLIGDGIGLTAFGWNRLNLLEELAERGIEAKAKVLDHSIGQYSKRSTSYSLTLEFSPDAHPTVTKTMTVDGNTYRSAVKNGVATVRYLAEDPDTCSAEKSALLPYQIVKVFGMIMLGAGIVVSWIVFRPKCRSTENPTAAVTKQA